MKNQPPPPKILYYCWHHLQTSKNGCDQIQQQLKEAFENN